jgi:hypothetical protein
MYIRSLCFCFQCVNKTGIVHKIDRDGDVVVELVNGLRYVIFMLSFIHPFIHLHSTLPLTTLQYGYLVHRSTVAWMAGTSV